MINIKNLTIALIVFVFLQIYSIIVFDLVLDGIRGFVWFIAIIIEIAISFFLVCDFKVFQKEEGNEK